MKNGLKELNFLKKYDPRLYRLVDLAQGYPKDDPHACLIRLRQFGELLARLWASKLNLFSEDDELYSDFLDRIYRDGRITPKVFEGLSHLKNRGNNALHGFQGDCETAADTLVIAKNLAHLFKSTFVGKLKGTQKVTSAPGPKIKPNTTDNNKKAKGEIASNCMEGEDYTGKELSSQDFSGKDLRGYDFTGANLIRANFCNTNLNNVSFKGADLRGANFEGAVNLHSNQLDSSSREGAIFPEELQRILDSKK